MESEVDPVIDQDLLKLEENGVKNIKDTISKLYNIWDEFGLELEQKSQRAAKVWKHVEKLLSDILNEENTYNKDVKERVKSYSNKLIELCNALSIPPKTFEGPLIKKEENLRRELDFLAKLRNQRVKTYQNLRITELKYCQSLNLPKHQLPPVLGVPSEDNIKELEQNVMQLKIEKERRHAKLCRMRQELTTIWETTEIVPESPLVKSVLSSTEDFPLSNETFKALEEAIATAQTQKTELEALKKELLNKLSVLWQRLKVEEKKRVEFLSKHADCRLSTIKSIEEELNRCEKIKKENIKMFVHSLRDELDNIWSSCFASEHQKHQFQFYSALPDTMDDAVLSAYDAEVDKWKKYHDEVKHILKNIVRRQELFELMVVFENRATDPNRFKNRRGNLLKEEKERKKLQRDLPALENEIFRDISVYEEQKGAPFLYYGEDYRAFVTNQWEVRKAQKESEKLERQKQHYIQLQNEVTIGTPAKRSLMTTPKSAPSKLFKSNLGLPCTPMSQSRKIPPCSVGKPSSLHTPLNSQPKRFVSKTVGKLTHSLRSTNFRPNSILSKDQNVLRERNQLVSLKKNKESSPNTTSYSDFIKDLNSTGRCSSRSSVLHTKKPGGTRISLNNSKNKRKSASKPLRRSTRNTSKIASSNLTPARGKFGLPFLI